MTCYIYKNQKGVCIKSKDIIAGCNIPDLHAVTVLSKLAKHDILTAKHGANGGFKKKFRSTAISLLDIIEAIDGTMRNEVVVEQDMIDAQPHLRINFKFDKFTSNIRNMLSAVTVHELNN